MAYQFKGIPKSERQRLIRHIRELSEDFYGGNLMLKWTEWDEVKDHWIIALKAADSSQAPATRDSRGRKREDAGEEAYRQLERRLRRDFPNLELKEV